MTAFYEQLTVIMDTGGFLMCNMIAKIYHHNTQNTTRYLFVLKQNLRFVASPEAQRVDARIEDIIPCRKTRNRNLAVVVCTATAVGSFVFT